MLFHFELLSISYKLQSTLGIKVRNMKMDFNTWHQDVSGRAMNTNDEHFFIRLSRLVALYNNIKKIFTKMEYF